MLLDAAKQDYLLLQVDRKRMRETEDGSKNKTEI